MKPRLLDLFCGAGGAARGYMNAGFHVVGVDIRPQPNYCGDEFIQADALELLKHVCTGWDYGGSDMRHFAAIHASPPCQAYTQLAKGDHPRLVEPVRDLLVEAGLPYVIENVVGAPLEKPATLCGSMFGLRVRRHRLFETNWPLMAPSCHHENHGGRIRAYYGKKGWLVWTPAAAAVQKKGRTPLLRGSVDDAPKDMGIDWMETWDELREAIPPAYTELIGHQLMQHIQYSDRDTDGRDLMPTAADIERAAQLHASGQLGKPA